MLPLLPILAYLGGVLTILSPCILPVLPFVFARAQQPFLRNGLPLLAGMGVTFAGVATLAAVGGSWVVQANQYGRWLAIALLAVFGLALLLPGLADRLMRPLVNSGSRLSNFARTDGHPTGPASSFLLGIATGLLWAPCAGPILGLVLTGAALQGPSLGTSLLLVAYAAGAATSLAIALLIGGRVFAAMKRSLHAGEWVRRGIGAAMLAGVAAIALGLDTGVLSRISTVATGGLEQRLIDGLSPGRNGSGTMTMQAQPVATSTDSAERGLTAADRRMALPVEGPFPGLDGAVEWLNSPPLTAEALRGKVVLVDFWTYSCINCLRTLPYLKAWAEKYRDQGLVVIGVHAPEFAFERNTDNVRKAARDLGVSYPIAIDNNYAIWRAFGNNYWPAHYFIDAQGRVRFHHFGEGAYEKSEAVIRQLIAEAGNADVDKLAMTTRNAAQGVEMAADNNALRSPEAYIGHTRAENFASPGGVKAGQPKDYAAPSLLGLNQWGLAGNWNVGEEKATLEQPNGRIIHRFHARDLHLVLGPGEDGKPIRFRVTIDGNAPGVSHGTDVAADGSGVVTAQRLYQLVRQREDVRDRTFAIEFLDPGVQAFAFTFG
ncbi:cytochrome C biogenesis protein DipZ [Cupriavidus sp. TA19]|uniref:cytochrome c biogenesis protein DipZ n=1 Tax=unclassified Cupriavidus TaxID=2640874 RepID=UPI000E2EC605|nr:MULTISPECIES: cytochrome c biogenesis protein DipZ [unclassified Cupriavidus]BDB28840.1 cytochrome c biogenesis protein DipZ [Cupriavidus sp. P-10]GLC97400.1 cytochrome C biogenesis protein DipZ [Cupriavidus sp. TA19]